MTPLHPDSNHLDILTQHVAHLRRGEPVLKPVYSHQTGEVRAARRCTCGPAKFLVVEGLLNFHTETLRTLHDVRVALAPPEELRRAWKLKRDCTRRGYTTDEVLAELDARQVDAEEFIVPQRRHADIVVAFAQNNSSDLAHLDADLILRDSLPHPDLSPLLTGTGPSLLKRGRGSGCCGSRATWNPAHAAELEEAVWEKMSFASHLRIRRLGEFTVGTDLFRSDSLALVQLLILYHVVTARAALSIGGSPPRADPRFPTGADSLCTLRFRSIG